MGFSNRAKSLFTKGLHEMDIFDDPVHLKAEGDRALKTSIGGFVSLAFLCFMATQTIIQIVNMFQYNGPSVLQMNEYQDDPPVIDLNRTNNFAMAVSATINNEPVDMSVLSVVSFTSFYSQYFRHSDGTMLRVKAEVYWAPCTEENFAMKGLGEETFSTYALKFAYCPTKIDFFDKVNNICPDFVVDEYPDCVSPPNFAVQGTFLSNHFQFVQLKLYQCNPAHASHIQGLTCDTPANMLTKFNTAEVQLNLYFTNSLIDPVNYHQPNKTFLDSIYWNLHPSVSQFVDIFIDSETVQDFDSFLNADAEVNSTFYNVQKDSMREMRSFQSSSLVTFNLRRSNINHVISRNYVKFLDVISNIGGIGGMLAVLGTFMVMGYSSYKYKMMISNELYEFQVIDEPKNKKGGASKVSSADQSEIQDINRNRSVFAFMGTGRRTNLQRNQTIREYFETQKKKQRRLEYGEWKFIKFCFMKLFCKKDPEEILAEKAREQVVKDLDIINILEKLHEVDKLKLLLLNKYQREAFNFIEKPVITMDNPGPVRQESINSARAAKKGDDDDSHMKFASLSKYAKLYAAYKHLKEDNIPTNTIYNKKLLDMIGPELLHVFKHLDRTLGDNADPKVFEETVARILDNNMESVLCHVQTDLENAFENKEKEAQTAMTGKDLLFLKKDSSMIMKDCSIIKDSSFMSND